MRPVDTPALENVAPALRVGAPITALDPVDFDDGVLQQTLDVGPFLQVPALAVWYEQRLEAAADQVFRTETNVASLIGIGVTNNPWEPRLQELGLFSVDTCDVYVMGVPQAYVSLAVAANLDECASGIVPRSRLYLSDAANPVAVMMTRGSGAESTNPLETDSGDWSPLGNAINPDQLPGWPGPWWLAPSSSLAFMLDTDAAGMCEVLFKVPLLFIRKGLPLPLWRGAWNAR